MPATRTEAMAMVVGLVGALARLEQLRAKNPEEGEENTYGLPEGEDLRREMRKWFEAQRKYILERIPETELPESFPPLADFDDPMASAMTPIIGAYWSRSGKTTYSRLGLDPEDWKVRNPHLEAKIRGATLKFCAKTNRTTSERLDTALGRLRESFVQGLVTEGESVKQLSRRVSAIFTGMKKWKATQIAATEASRAVHAAQYQADIESDVVAGVELLLSGDACPLCRKIATEAKTVRLGQPFAVIGADPDYREVRHPPLHPHCQCAMIEILKPDVGGPVHPQFSETLVQPQEGLGDDYKPPAGKTVPEPEPEKAPAVQAKPIAERIADYDADGKLEKLGTFDVEVDQARREWTQAALEATKEEHRLALRPDVTKEEFAKFEEQQKKVRELEARYFGVKDSLINRVGLLLRQPKDNRAEIRSTGADGHPAEFSIKAGERFLGQVLAGKGKSVEATYAIGTDGRGGYLGGKARKIELQKGHLSPLVVHEWAHAIEDQWPEVGERSREFLEHRVGSEKLQKLNDVYPKRKYEAWEEGRKDKFEAAFPDQAYYVGKHYPWGSTEILSMGLEKLLTDPAGFAKNDPEYCKFVLGILDGSLR